MIFGMSAAAYTLLARANQSNRNRLRINRFHRAARWEAARSLDCDLFGEYRLDECNRVRFPL
jgi:hypothetical protein